MSPLEILTFPEEFLRNPVRPVEQIDGVLQTVIDRMAETMYQAPGVGLAAIQVGLDKSLLVYDITSKENGRDLHVLINPRIIAQEGQIISENEGCLSVPDFRADVQRFAHILVEGLDRDGKPLRFEAEGFPAVVLQHEIDHLNGILFLDRISALKRQLYTRRVKKQLKHQGA
ncbi:MAG: peptide deformylase [Desulfobacteraceae bacterium]|nr:MAG: peptide deformylase [Desulfobacteraceae bacterium]